MKQYSKPQFKLIRLNSADIITTSDTMQINYSADPIDDPDYVG